MRIVVVAAAVHHIWRPVSIFAAAFATTNVAKHRLGEKAHERNLEIPKRQKNSYRICE
jgi:hypothetical protein